MPGLSGVQLQDQLVRMQCGLPIVFMTAHGDIATSVRAIKAGAEDFLTKPMDKETLLDAVQRAMRRYWAAHVEQNGLRELRTRLDSLTAREREVFDLVLTGLLNKQIAGQLGNTERTVKAHRHALMEKMGVKSVAELAAIAARLGILARAELSH
jgi:FixJ family two-component response regulator